MAEVKPGYKTTEFWVNAVSALSGVAMTVGVKGADVVNVAAEGAGEELMSDPTTGAIGIGLAALNAAIYAGSRGKLKAKEAEYTFEDVNPNLVAKDENGLYFVCDDCQVSRKRE